MKKTLLAISIGILSINAHSYEVSDIKDISAGKYKTFFTLENGYLYTTNNLKKDANNLSNLELISSDVLTSSVGTNHAFKITNENKLYSVGSNEFGALGLNNFKDSESWKLIDDIKKATKAISDNGVSFIIDSEKVLYAAGYNFHKLINDVDEKINSFTKIATDVIDADGSLMYIAYLDSKKDLYIKGHPQYGFQSFKTFTKIASNVDSISGGHYHLLFISKGELMGIGANHQGQLGEKIKQTKGDNFLSNFTDKPIKLASNVVSASAGNYHSMYVNVEKKLFVAGNNGNGQLGIGTQDLSNEWKQTLDNVKSIFSGSYNSFVIKGDDTLWIAGNNSEGQLTFKSDKENTYFYGKEMRTNVETWSWRPIYFKTFEESYNGNK
jgi:alpha-tubulin suppressor-like RCC1 family protein